MWRTRRTVAWAAEAVAVAAVLAAAAVFLAVKGLCPAHVHEPTRQSAAPSYAGPAAGGPARPVDGMQEAPDTKGPSGRRHYPYRADVAAALADHYPIVAYLHVKSAPVSGVAIGGQWVGAAGSPGGTTDYTLSVIGLIGARTGWLEAPQIATVGGVQYVFVRWRGFPDGQNSISVTIGAPFEQTVWAEYVIRTWTLRVQSRPCVGAEIEGTAPGTTDYAETRANQDVVVLTAPPKPCVNGHYTNFLYWVVDGEPQAEGQVSVQITMNADRTAEARYDLLGDVNGDCRVNILDLIFIRNRLSATPDLDNSRADVNKDGTIHLLDLIKVRNELAARCE